MKPKTITKSVKAYKENNVWDQTQNIIDIIDEGAKGVLPSTAITENFEQIKKICDVVYVGMVIGDKELTAKEFYKNLTKTLNSIYTVNTTNPPKNG